MRRYAEDTDVPVEKSRAEIETLLRKHGASGMLSGWDGNKSFVAFVMHNRNVRLVLPLPDRTDQKFTHFRHSSGQSLPRKIEVQHELWEQACRQSWRALALVIRAKLEAVAAGITIFEDEFLAHIILPDGRTVGQAIRHNIALAYETKQVRGLLPDYSEKD